MSGGIRSHVAAVAKPLEERLRTKWDFKSIALTVGAMVLASTGIGLAGSYVMDRWRNSHQANVKKDVLAKEFRNHVGATLGIDPNKVTAHHLEEAAKRDGVLRQVVKKIDDETNSANRAAALSNGAAFAVGGFIPGVGGISKLAMDGAAMVGGGMVSSLFDKDELQLTDVVSHLDGKKRAGQPITEHDLLLLKISQNQQWQKAFKKMHGYAFHKGTPEQQRVVMNSMPGLGNLSELAARVNMPNTQVADIPAMLAANDNGQGFAAQHARGGRGGSFVQSLNAERAAASSNQLA